MGNRKYEIDILMDQRYDDLKDLFVSYNEEGARFNDINTMVEHLDHEDLLEGLEITQDELDLVVTGEAVDLDTAEELLSLDN